MSWEPTEGDEPWATDPDAWKTSKPEPAPAVPPAEPYFGEPSEGLPPHEDSDYPADFDDLECRGDADFEFEWTFEEEDS